MLTAIISGKAGRFQLDGTEHRVSWRNVFRRSEDLLTATFFGRFRYLSERGLTLVMAQLIGQDAAENLGSLRDIEFWPRLVGLDGRAWVEPDVVMRFDKGLLLVEVKPPFGGEQYLEQWQAEVHALVAECLSRERVIPDTVHFLGLGRNTLTVNDDLYAKFDVKTCFDLMLHTREWDALIKAFLEIKLEESASDRAVIEDWLQAFELFELQRQTRGWPELVRWTHKSLSLSSLAAWPPRVTAPQLAPSATISVDWLPIFNFSLQQPLALEPWI